jgi:hypothetical protein
MQRKSKMFPAEKQKLVVDWILKASDRSSQRRALALKWLDEGEYSNYRYNVETCDDGKRVYLLRPTWLNKGFDFQVNVEGFRSDTRKPRGSTVEMPSHEDLGHDIGLKLKAAPELKEALFKAICDVYDCVEPDEILSKSSKLRDLRAGLPIDKLLRTIKWLFIEQDLTYWNQTGRNMLMCAIEEKTFGISAKRFADS